MHPASRNSNRICVYKKYENELNFTGITFPVQLNQISEFEKQNNISLNILGLAPEKKGEFSVFVYHAT